MGNSPKEVALEIVPISQQSLSNLSANLIQPTFPDNYIPEGCTALNFIIGLIPSTVSTHMDLMVVLF